VEDTKRMIVAAVREGSDFVELATVGHGTISLLVTPNLPVRFETIQRTEKQLVELEEDPPPIDSSAFSEWDHYA
jgi:hypothetical protein